MAHILESLRVRPVLAQDQAGVFLIFDLPQRLRASQPPGQAQLQTADPREQRANAERHPVPLLISHSPLAYSVRPPQQMPQASASA